ncbi:MAG: BACON domain-containing protein [Nitrospiraceae bacterium]
MIIVCKTLTKEVYTVGGYHLENLNHRLRTNKALTWNLNLRWVIGLSLATSLFGVSEAWALESATVTQVVTDAAGATITIQGPGQVLEFIYNAQSTYTGIPSFTAGSASFRHTFTWPQGTTFVCYRTKGTNNLYTEQGCAPVTPGPAPTIGVSPTSLTFSGAQGGTNPAALTVSITNTGSGTLSWTVSDNAAWLSRSPASGTAPGNTTVSVNTAGLAAGTYNATITVTATGATNTPQSVPVTLTVTAPVGQSAIVTSVVPDVSGATVTIQGPGQVLEFIYNAQSTYTGIPSFTAGTASFRHTFAWPQGTTFACYRTKGTNNLYNEQACAPVTPGSPPTSGTATLTWNASPTSDLAGYKVYVGTASGVYGPATSVGNVTTYRVLNLTTGQTYYFSVTAVDTSGNESDYSNEVSKSIY